MEITLDNLSEAKISFSDHTKNHYTIAYIGQGYFAERNRTIWWFKRTGFKKQKVTSMEEINLLIAEFRLKYLDKINKKGGKK